MDREESAQLLLTADEIALRMEEAIGLNGRGAEVIRELTNVFRNYQQASVVWRLVVDRYEQLVEAQDGLLQANLALQKEMVALATRVLELERMQAQRRL